MIEVTWYNLIFFHVFRRYYKNGRYRNDIPWLTASVIVGMSSLLYLLTAIVLIYYFANGEMPELDKRYALPIGVAFVALNCLWFIGDDRYLRIFDEFKESYLKDRFTEILSWFYIFAAYVFFILIIVNLRI